MLRVAFALTVAGAFLTFSCGSNRAARNFVPDAAAPTDAAPLDAAPAFTLSVTPSAASAMVAIGVAGQTVTFKATRLDPGATSGVDVSSQVTWSIAQTTLAVANQGGTFTLQGIGGQSQVSATLSGVVGTAMLTVEATGNVFFGGTTSASQATFASATPDPTPADAPTLQYPLPGVVLPGNIPPIDFQWSQGAMDNNLYRVHLTSPGVLDIDLYTSSLDLVADATTWGEVVASTPDAPVTWTVDATGTANQLRTSAPATLTITSDTIDNTAIYAWQTSTQTFHVLDMTTGTDVELPNNSPQLAPGQPCAGCHRISRDGTRFAFTFTGNFQFGTLAYDAGGTTFSQQIAPSSSFIGTYAAFNPLESTQVPAMLVSGPDVVPQNTAGTVSLLLHDPDTNAVVPSNLAAMLAMLGTPNPGQAALMPDWSPDGSFVVFAAYNSGVNFVRDLGDDIVLASIIEAPVSFSAGTFTFGAPKVLVAANSSDDADTGQNNFLPAISPDGTAVAFTRAAGWWSLKTQVSPINLSGQIMIVRRSDGTVFELVNGSNGAGMTLSSTWPQWAPTLGSKYGWLAYGSERPYGHLLTPTNKNCGALVQGQQSCKQLWVTAINLQMLQNGTADPSLPPFWIPGQSIAAQYVSPQWTKAVIPPPQ
jgi:Tol biopolymer transport system component